MTPRLPRVEISAKLKEILGESGRIVTPHDSPEDIELP